MSDNLPVRAQHAAPLQERLERYYKANHSNGIQISEFTSISDGWETEVYSFTATLNQQIEHLILRMYPGANAAEKCVREYNGMFCLQTLNRYPVPVVMDHVQDKMWLDKPFIIMQKINGRPFVQIMYKNPTQWKGLLTFFCQLFVNLHQLDCDPFLWLSPDILQNDPFAFLHHKLVFARNLMIDQLQQKWVKPVLDWLEAHMAGVPTSGLSVLHGDFNWSNVLLTPDNEAYVIDWSQIEVGDYRYDLAWTLLLTQPPEARDLTISEYERLSGHQVEQIEYFEVIAALRRLFDMAASLTSGAESLGMRPETVAVMRQQRDHYQQVYALLQNITGLNLPEIERLIDSLQT